MIRLGAAVPCLVVLLAAPLPFAAKAEEGVGNGVQQHQGSPVATPPQVVRSWPSIGVFLGLEKEEPVMELSDLKVRTDIKEAIVRSVKCLIV